MIVLELEAWVGVVRTSASILVGVVIQSDCRAACCRAKMQLYQHNHVEAAWKLATRDVMP